MPLLVLPAMCEHLNVSKCCVLADHANPAAGGKDAGAVAKVKELYQRIKDLEHKLAIAETKLISQAEAKEFAVKAARFETQIEMQKSIEAAYEKGYARCKDALESNMALLKSMRSE